MRGFTILAALIAGSFATTISFTADILVLYDPDIYGSLSGTMAYEYDGGSNNFLKLQYSLAAAGSTTYSNYTTISDYANGASYSQCSGSCTAQTIATDAPLLFAQSGESSGTGTTCIANTRASSTSDTVINQIAFNAAGICYVVYGSGRRIEFSNVVTNSGSLLPASTFSYSSWGCPTKSCNEVMDLALILDVSGSINDAAYKSLQNFTKTLSTAFTLGTSAVEMSIITFSTDATLVQGLTASQTDINTAVASLPRDQKSTCIGCGIYTAIDVFSRAPSSRTSLNPMNVTITVTDGGNNIDATSGTYGCKTGKTNDRCYTYLKNSITALKAAPYNTLSIIVGVSTGDYNAAILSMMATNSTYVLSVSGYSALMTIIDTVVKVTCTSFETPTCGASCKGFCACGTTCLCPNDCTPYGNKCVTGSCSNTGGLTGCFNTSVSCDDGSACSTDSCDSATGCTHTEASCTSSDPCSDAACSNSTGCYLSPRSCSASDTCHTAACNSSGLCEQSLISATACSGGDPCYICNSSSTTCAVQAACQSSNPCNVSTCSSATGSAVCTETALCQDTSCSLASCSVVSGSAKCSYTARNCSDGLFCTDDYCNASASGTASGCYYKNHSCDDGNPCTTDSCSETGRECVHTASTVCDTGLFCQTDLCVPVNSTSYTCSHTAIQCPDNITFTLNVTSTLAKCYEIVCNETANACEWEFVASSESNPCSACRANMTSSSSTCGWKWSSADTAGLVAGAIAGIVIAAVIGAAIFASVSAAGVYKLVQMSRAGNNLKVNNNPMYKGNENEMTNPAYSAN